MAATKTKTTRPRVAPPTRGVEYFDAALGVWRYRPTNGKVVDRHSAEGEKAYASDHGQRAPGARGSARDALRRSGAVPKDAADYARRQAKRTNKVLERAGASPASLVGTGRQGVGGIVIYGIASIIGLGLLDALLSGRGPAGAERGLGFLGTAFRKLVDPHDPLIHSAAANGRATAPAARPPASSPAAAPGLQPTGEQPARQGTLPSQPAGVGGSVGTLPARIGYPLGTKGTQIGQPYVGSHLLFGNWESDNAIDLAVPVGTPVYALAAGTIGSQIGPLNASDPHLQGERLHLVTPGDEFYYAHLSKIVVKAGQPVRAGQLLGYSGSANGVAHLHLAERATDALEQAGTASRHWYSSLV